MPFATNTGYSFGQQTIMLNAPTSSGVYGIYRLNVWIHVGESNDIQRRLAEHLTTAGTCILGITRLALLTNWWRGNVSGKSGRIS